MNRSTLPYILLSSAFSLALPAHTHTKVTVPQVTIPRNSIFSGVIIVKACSARGDTTAPSPKAGAVELRDAATSCVCSSGVGQRYSGELPKEQWTAQLRPWWSQEKFLVRSWSRLPQSTTYQFLTLFFPLPSFRVKTEAREMKFRVWTQLFIRFYLQYSECHGTST